MAFCSWRGHWSGSLTKRSVGWWVNAISRRSVVPLILLVAMAAGSVAGVSGQTATTEPSQPAAPPAPAADLAAVLTPKTGDAPAVRQFKESGRNPYYQDPKAIADGFRLARASACTHCHGES